MHTIKYIYSILKFLIKKQQYVFIVYDEEKGKAHTLSKDMSTHTFNSLIKSINEHICIQESVENLLEEVNENDK